ncbi:MAG: hypothetical protein V1868_01600 [Patescibacteria group bacterium]
MDNNNEKKPSGGTFARLMAGSLPPQKAINHAPKAEAERNKEIKKERNITILQYFTDKDIKNLREPAYTVQTYRVRREDSDTIKDLAHTLSKKTAHRKISQADIVRIAFCLFEKLWEQDEKGVLELLEKIK